MMTWRRSEGKQEAREGEGIFQQEEAWMTIVQEDMIVHPFVLRQFHHNTASCCISQGGRSKKFHFGELGHLDFWEQFVETYDMRENLGFTLDCHLTMNAHVSTIARTCYFELRHLASICRFLTSTATATLVSAFVLSRIDYCNSLLFGSTNDVTSHLQRIQNYAARVILRLPMSSSITIHLKSLHWIPVRVRSTYKIACLCYRCHSSTAPSYVTDMLHKKPLHTRNTRSSSYTMPLLNRPAHSKAKFGDCSFSFASSFVWNSIPNDVRCAPSLSSSKTRLKTYLFCSAYKD